jgi:hypothetical protein
MVRFIDAAINISTNNYTNSYINSFSRLNVHCIFKIFTKFNKNKG